MYHSAFYDMLYRINRLPEWRRILRSPQPDLHMKDIEILLRAFAMLIRSEDYAPSMVRFLNQFSRMCEGQTAGQNDYLENLFGTFLEKISDLPENIFVNERNNRFNIALFEATFTGLLENAFKERRGARGKANAGEIQALAGDREFTAAALEGTTRTTNVTTRLERARTLLTAL